MTALPYRIDTAHFLQCTEAADTLLSSAQQACSDILQQPGAKAIFRSANDTQDIAQLLNIATRWRQSCRHLVVIGAGGSGLSGRALSMLKTGLHSYSTTHTLHILDNLDVHAFPSLLASLPLEETALLMASKSGSTVETYALSRLMTDAMEHHGTLGERVCAITVPGSNPLRALAEAHHIPLIDHDPDLGGRFSILSAVGLLPAAFMGLDIAAIRTGAVQVFDSETGYGSNAMCGAAHLVAQLYSGRNITVMMPYCERLYGIALWWRQSWAESLGKKELGSTPVANIGTTDQHSQLQLYLGGPDDKSFTLLLAEREGQGPRLPQIDGALSYLSGHTLGDLIAAQQEGTRKTLTGAGRPVRVMHVGNPDERVAGALIAHFTLEILFAGAMMNINPFDQPAVEESKRLAHSYLTQRA